MDFCLIHNFSEASVSCNSFQTTSTGNITSVNYPSDYPNNADCSYIIEVTDASSIGIHFRDFKTQPENDVLHYGHGNVVNMDDVLDTYQGISIPDDITVQGNAVWFRFVSDDSVADRGYWLTWQSFTGMK